MREYKPGSSSMREKQRVAPVHYYGGPMHPPLPGMPLTGIFPGGGAITPVVRERGCTGSTFTEKKIGAGDVIWVSLADDKRYPTSASYGDTEELAVVIDGSWIRLWADIAEAGVQLQLTDGETTVTGGQNANAFSTAPVSVRIPTGSFADGTYCTLKIRTKKTGISDNEEVKNFFVTMGS